LAPPMLIGLVADPRPVKFKLLIVKSSPSVVDRLVAPLVTVKKTFDPGAGTTPASVKVACVVDQLVEPVLKVFHRLLWPPNQYMFWAGVVVVCVTFRISCVGVELLRSRLYVWPASNSEVLLSPKELVPSPVAAVMKIDWPVFTVFAIGSTTTVVLD